jgi:hypothetical protein
MIQPEAGTLTWMIDMAAAAELGSRRDASGRV